jgi:hypothetical protein
MGNTGHLNGLKERDSAWKEWRRKSGFALYQDLGFPGWVGRPARCQQPTDLLPEAETGCQGAYQC